MSSTAQHSKAKQTHSPTVGKGKGGRNERQETKQFRMCCGNEACVQTRGDQRGGMWVMLSYNTLSHHIVQYFSELAKPKGGARTCEIINSVLAPILPL